MRLLLLLALVAGGCGDDTTNGTGDLGAFGDDLSADGRDLSALTGDLICSNTSFNGFTGVQTSLAVFACPCGCTVDGMNSSVVNPMWGASHSPSSGFAPIAGVGLGENLHFDGTSTFELCALYSVGPTSQFFLDGDFDLLIDYDLGSSPPGETHLIVSVRDPGTVQGIQIFDIEREQLADGSNAYVTMLGGVPSNSVATTATHGTLRMTRKGFTYTTYGDGTMVSTLIAQKANRVALNVTATLNGCSTSDGASTCAYQPRFHDLRLASGTLVNLPN
jgi:hypothetical protein